MAVGHFPPPTPFIRTTYFHPNYRAAEELVASLVASTFAENQFLLIGTGQSTPISACDPDQDPVIMAVSFGKSSSGQRTVTVLLPGERQQ